MNVGGGGGGATSESDQPSSSTSYSSYSASFIPLSNLKSLRIEQCADLHNLEVGFKYLTSLKELRISTCLELKTLSSCLHHLTSLQRLCIIGWEEFNMSNGIDEILWKDLASLSCLRFESLRQLVSLPQGLQQVTTLQEMEIYDCINLEAVMDCISNLKSLKKLSIEECPKLKSLPEGIDSLTSLQKLEIRECPILLERCRDNIDDYWPKICHIKELVLWPTPNEKQSEQEESTRSEPEEEQSEQPESTSSKACGLLNCGKFFKH